MFPRQSMYRTPYGLLADMIVIGKRLQVFALLIALANGADVVFCQLCTVVIFAVYGAIRASLKNLTTLRCHVLRVRRVIAQKQMIRPDTQRIIAMVTNHRVFRNRAIGQLPRDARCLLHIPQVVDRTIAVCVLQSYPYPTTSGDLNLRPKAILDRSWARRKVIAISATTQRAMTGTSRVMRVHIDFLSVWPCVTRSIPQFS